MASTIPTFSSPAEPLIDEDTVRFIQARRRGYSSERVVQNTIEQQQTLLDQRISSLIMPLVERQTSAEEVITELLTTVETIDLISTHADRIEALRQTVENLKSTQQDLQNTLQAGEEKLKLVQVQRAQLHETLKELDMALDKIPKVDHSIANIYKLGKIACKNISHSKT